MNDFAQTRDVEDLFESEISTKRPQAPVDEHEPRPKVNKMRFADVHRTGRNSETHPGNFQAGLENIRSEQVPEKSQDRTLSGGVKKAKLTDEEWSKRMHNIDQKNRALVAKYDKATRDEQDFRKYQKDHKSSQRSNDISQQLHKQNVEREKNRERKLKSSNNREWDSGKQEDCQSTRHLGGRSRNRELRLKDDSIASKSRTLVGAESSHTERISSKKNPCSDLQTLSGVKDGRSWADQVESGNME